MVALLRLEERQGPTARGRPVSRRVTGSRTRAYCGGQVDLHAEALGRVPDPARVVENRARHRHHVGFARSDDFFRPLRSAIMPTARIGTEFFILCKGT
jgi:xanthine/CO dehydrogenase XdhC/CoxF family maturation factor